MEDYTRPANLSPRSRSIRRLAAPVLFSARTTHLLHELRPPTRASTRRRSTRSCSTRQAHRPSASCGRPVISSGGEHRANIPQESRCPTSEGLKAHDLLDPQPSGDREASATHPETGRDRLRAHRPGTALRHLGRRGGPKYKPGARRSLSIDVLRPITLEDSLSCFRWPRVLGVGADFE